MGPFSQSVSLLVSLLAEEVLLPSIASFMNYSFSHRITWDQMNGFSLDLIWRLGHWNIVHSITL
jgi:hypothetical protein